ncbi:LacI family DNA-binding transcriptional regulator [Terrarubrum flagellatum]|uniref:LacI family DNA-binding transcriptional regulator n=1 Tax=Terrirubrum flagellatum TaxID=2895980 RepID=UPI0031451B90
MTVSRVLNGQSGASIETRQRVLDAAAALDYRPNAFAKNLRKDRSKIVGIVVPDIVNPFFPEIIRGAELAARPAGYTLITTNVVEDPARELEALDALRDRRVDGMILCSARLDDKTLMRAAASHRAMVVINRVLPKSVAGSIEIDYRTGVETLVESLIAKGRRRFAYAGGLPTSYGGAKRREGLGAALTRHNLKLIANLPSSPDLPGGAAVAREIGARRAEIDAVICYNDLVAIGMIGALKASGVKTPDDIAVTGCDDILLAAHVSPALTTLRVDKEELGELAMRMLLDRIERRNIQQRIIIEPDIIFRDSA